MGDPLMYCGLPRTVSGYGAMAYVLSHFFFAANPARYAVGAVLIGAFALLNLLPIPYMTHRGTRRMQTHVQILALAVPGDAPGGVLRGARLHVRRAVLLDARLRVDRLDPDLSRGKESVLRPLPRLGQRGQRAR